MGFACVFMAAKIEEVHPPKAADLVAFFGGTRRREDRWKLHPTTPYAWLLHMVAGGRSTDEHPLKTMGDFVNPSRNPSGTKEFFVNDIRLVDIAFLDYQAIEY
ncbi:hypothetical protein PsorP6_012963 [Peronosclerospora sorghi]|uniref:Uncharacterized protein n=1 Tax=Peronosclerospora sorghi TaxID=230839 RepID=A0ACC0WGL2_9STRA|nr:hypothetical protein PsorP6_012963 [Peronosclerospora sorghi]